MRLMSAVPSPCIDVCRLNPVTHICAGCSRTIFEIDAWPSLSDAEKLEILQRIADAAATRDAGAAPPTRA